MTLNVDGNVDLRGFTDINACSPGLGHFYNRNLSFLLYRISLLVCKSNLSPFTMVIGNPQTHNSPMMQHNS